MKLSMKLLDCAFNVDELKYRVTLVRIEDEITYYWVYVDCYYKDGLIETIKRNYCDTYTHAIFNFYASIIQYSDFKIIEYGQDLI